MGNGGLECCTQVLNDDDNLSDDGDETKNLLDKTIINEYIERNNKNCHQPSNSAEANGEMDDLIEKEDQQNDDSPQSQNYQHEFIATQDDTSSSLSSTLSSEHDEHEEHKHGYIDNNNNKTDANYDLINLEGTPSLSFPVEDELDKQILALMKKSPEPIEQPPVHIPSVPTFPIVAPNLPNLPTDSLEMKKTRSKERKKSKREQFETLKQELDEAEIRLKQQKRIQQVLKKENDALRKENSMLKFTSGKCTNYQEILCA